MPDIVTEAKTTFKTIIYLCPTSSQKQRRLLKLFITWAQHRHGSKDDFQNHSLPEPDIVMDAKTTFKPFFTWARHRRETKTTFKTILYLPEPDIVTEAKTTFKTLLYLRPASSQKQRRLLNPFFTWARRHPRWRCRRPCSRRRCRGSAACRRLRRTRTGSAGSPRPAPRRSRGQYGCEHTWRGVNPVRLQATRVSKTYPVLPHFWLSLSLSTPFSWHSQNCYLLFFLFVSISSLCVQLNPLMKRRSPKLTAFSRGTHTRFWSGWRKYNPNYSPEITCKME